MKYFIKGIVKTIGYILGFCIFMIPITPLLLYAYISLVGGDDKAIDEYCWARRWMEFWDNLRIRWDAW